MKTIYGIDLGTTYSSIAYVDDFGKAVIIPNAENQPVTPSVVFFDGDTVVVGDVAKESSKLYPEEVVSYIKRSMGDPNYIFEYNNKYYKPEEISSYIIKKVIIDAEQYLNEKITDIVITCPAYFGINERESTRMAGEIAGYNVRQIINEPTAAAIAYGTVESNERKVVLVYDLGGGTFDITLIEIQPDSIEVICTGGDHNLGGKDWDDRIVASFVQEFQRLTNTDEDILDDPDTCQDLQLSAEKSKKVLSQRDRTTVSVTHGGERVKVDLTREKFEEVTRDLLERTIAFTHDMLDEAKKKGYNTFDEIILVGGSTRMPQVPLRIKQEFGMDPKMFDPDGAVAKGAAIYGWKLSLNDGMIKKLAEKTSKKTNEIDLESVTATRVKEVAKEIASETGYTLAAVERANIKIKDVTSKSFGVVVRNPQNIDIIFNLILKNTSVPAECKKTFHTGVANQDTVLIRIMEDEISEQKIDIKNAVEIGTAILSLPPSLPADMPIDIYFKLNKEGRLQITAVEGTESRSVNAVIETTSVISGKELEEAKVRCQSIVIH
ncbi:MAG: Hsp70 family protein [Desulfobacterales bacterium]|nr:Hsp70 family protein [Desulfobacterales bacterium]